MPWGAWGRLPRLEAAAAFGLVRHCQSASARLPPSRGLEVLGPPPCPAQPCPAEWTKVVQWLCKSSTSLKYQASLRKLCDDRPDSRALSVVLLQCHGTEALALAISCFRDCDRSAVWCRLRRELARPEICLNGGTSRRCDVLPACAEFSSSSHMLVSAESHGPRVEPLDEAPNFRKESTQIGSHRSFGMPLQLLQWHHLPQTAPQSCTASNLVCNDAYFGKAKRVLQPDLPAKKASASFKVGLKTPWLPRQAES